ncbi:AMP-binding protein [Pseudomonas gingeri]|uniref:AMP-binding protein n=1 Tax=Pseudomonas gingeri TaxID=117681 RepID=UPI0015A20E8D|nr:AMP-binding protein [Pseudomonas gingeri]NWE25258.1 AMP-binding protein [Pseudomonas gingeri]NWE94767.1 AMP-binding protein [Pseudomonas gingeri]
MSAAFRLPLEVFYEREARHPRQPYLVQPLGGGEVQTLSWSEVGHQARCAAHWLRARELPQGSHVAIISKNCAHWIIADLAIWMAGHVSVPLYPNLTADSVAQVLEHSGAALAFIGKLDDWPGMKTGVPRDLPTIGLPLCPAGDFDFRWVDLQACSPIQDDPLPAAQQLATVIYTSGTTGQPKGVMHSFATLSFAANHAIGLFGLGEHDRLLSYLPLCHVAERMFVELASLFTGQTVFFAESLETFLVDLKRARPTAMFGVPRIWSKFQMGVHERIAPARLDLLLRLPLLGRYIGRKVLAGLGLDALRIALSGAAPLGLCVLSASAAEAPQATLQAGLQALLEEVNHALDKHQRLRALVVVKDSWAVENGFLTPTLKLKRAVIEQCYGARFQAWSEHGQPVLWQQ